MSDGETPGTEAREILRVGLAELGIASNDKTLDAFDRYTLLLLEWNSKFNLTRITDPVEIAVKHYLDSLAVLKYMEIGKDSRLIDVGTGAGFPGIPLKIVVPGLRLVLMDSLQKRLGFLETVINELGLKGVQLVHSRAEDLARDRNFRDKFDYATARAVSRMSVLTELCLPFVRPGGLLFAYKGPDARAEVKEALKAVQALGGAVEIVEQFTLPNSDQGRTLVIIKKKMLTPPRFPRKSGIPEKEPI